MNMLKKIVGIALCAALIAASCIFVVSCSSEKKSGSDGKKSQAEIHEMMNNITDEDRAEYRKTVERFVDYLSGDGESVRDLFPDGYWDGTGKTEEEAVADSIEFCNKDREKNKEIFGEDFVITYDIISEQNYILMIEEIREKIENVCGISCEGLDKVCYIDVVFTASGSVSSNQYEKAFYAVRLDGKWYLANEIGSFN